MITNRPDRIRRRAAFGALLVVALTACSAPTAGSTPAAGTDPLLISTDAGPVRGRIDGASVLFHGIRYAAAPTGERRWAAPEQPVPWTEPFDATGPGVTCPQTPVPNAPPITEDCLTVNVTAPADRAPDGRLPVMLWWHGGGYFRDGGAFYGAQRLAERGRVVVVTANYRLGALGYLAQPGLAGSGTFGLADQIASLGWVERNAAAFGGDPDNITVFGESGGATSTCAALTSPAAAGRIDKAIMSSGTCEIDWPPGVTFPGTPAQQPYAPLAQTEQLSAEVAAQVGCPASGDVLACLRALPAEAFDGVGAQYFGSLSYGTPLLPEPPADVVAAGRAAAVPVIVGSNRYEQRAQVGGAAMVTPITDAELPGLRAAAFGAAPVDAAEQHRCGFWRSLG